jgi:TPR repeat protein
LLVLIVLIIGYGGYWAGQLHRLPGWTYDEAAPNEPPQHEQRIAANDPCGVASAAQSGRSNSALEQCANRHDAAAQAQLGMLYWGASISEHCDIKGCRMGDPSTFGLGPTLSVATLQREGQRLLEAAADAGNAPAQNELGVAYLDGSFGLARDSSTALRLLQSASESGNALAAWNLARMYFSGRGVPRSIENGQRLLRMSAGRGYHAAKCSLAHFLEHESDATAVAEARALREEIFSSRAPCSSVDIMSELP